MIPKQLVWHERNGTWTGYVGKAQLFLIEHRIMGQSEDHSKPYALKFLIVRPGNGWKVKDVATGKLHAQFAFEAFLTDMHEVPE